MSQPRDCSAAAHAPWTELARQLYPNVVRDPPLYERALRAARVLADGLGSASSAEQLTASWPRAVRMLEAACAAHGVAASGLPLEHVAAAAFALREREIALQVRRESLRRRVEAAREAGAAWVLLHEAGAVDAGVNDAYQCTEMHVASGLAVVSQAQPDPVGGAVTFAVSIVRLDPASGELVDPAPGIDDWVECAHPEGLRACRVAARRRVEGLAAVRLTWMRRTSRVFT